MSFFSKIVDWSASSQEDMERINKNIMLELFASVISDTPVLQGRLRGNWIITSTNPADGTAEVADPSGVATTQKVVQHVTRLDASKDFDVYLTNNLPYAYRIEYDGYSKIKAPEGMVRRNLIRISSLL